MTQNKTLSQAIAEVKNEIIYPFGANSAAFIEIEKVDKIIREQDRRITRAHAWLIDNATHTQACNLRDRSGNGECNCGLSDILAATSPDAEWKV